MDNRKIGNSHIIQLIHPLTFELRMLIRNRVSNTFFVFEKFGDINITNGNLHKKTNINGSIQYFDNSREISKLEFLLL